MCLLSLHRPAALGLVTHRCPRYSCFQPNRPAMACYYLQPAMSFMTLAPPWPCRYRLRAAARRPYALAVAKLSCVAHNTESRARSAWLEAWSTSDQLEFPAPGVDSSRCEASIYREAHGAPVPGSTDWMLLPEHENDIASPQPQDLLANTWSNSPLRRSLMLGERLRAVRFALLRLELGLRDRSLLPPMAIIALIMHLRSVRSIRRSIRSLDAVRRACKTLHRLLQVHLPQDERRTLLIHISYVPDISNPANWPAEDTAPGPTASPRCTCIC